jgi:hypothetical protein
MQALKILEDSLTCTCRLPPDIVKDSSSIWRDIILHCTDSLILFLLQRREDRAHDSFFVQTKEQIMTRLCFHQITTQFMLYYLSVAFLRIWFQTNLRSCTLTPFHCIRTHFTSYCIGNFNTLKGILFLALC